MGRTAILAVYFDTWEWTGGGKNMVMFCVTNGAQIVILTALLRWGRREGEDAIASLSQ